jgi:hypothetical protein
LTRSDIFVLCKYTARVRSLEIGLYPSGCPLFSYIFSLKVALFPRLDQLHWVVLPTTLDCVIPLLNLATMVGELRLSLPPRVSNDDSNGRLQERTALVIRLIPKLLPDLETFEIPISKPCKPVVRTALTDTIPQLTRLQVLSLGNFTSGTLRGVHLSILGADPDYESSTTELVTALGLHHSHSLRYLDLSWRDVPLKLSSDTISPLLACAAISSANICAYNCALTMKDADIEVMAKSWSLLEHLRVYWCDGRPGIGLGALSALARHCSSLKSLYIGVDTTISPLSPKHSDPPTKSTSTRAASQLYILNLAGSILGSNVGHLAEVINSTFPNLRWFHANEWEGSRGVSELANISPAAAGESWERVKEQVPWRK